QTALQRHLAAFEADLVVAALAGALTLHAAAAGLALAGRCTAADAQTRLAAAGSGRECVQTHSLLLTSKRPARRSAGHFCSSTFNMWHEARSMPRISGVSASITVSRMR